MKHLILALAALLACAAPLQAADYANGTYSDGYVYQNGYWYLGQQAYTRASVPYTYQAWDGYGRCYRSYTAYKYAYTAYTPPKVVEYAPDWREKVLQAAVENDRFERAERAKAIDQNNYIEAIRELGLTGSRRVQGYGQAISYASPFRVTGGYNLGVSNYGNVGSTVYGYSYNTITDLYGKTDLSVLQNQYARSVENSQVLGDKAVSGLGDLLKSDSDARERVATIIAKGQITSRLLEVMETPTAKTRTSVSGTVTVPDGALSSAAVKLQDVSALASHFQAAAGRVLNAKCISCHGADQPKGGLDLTNPFALSADVQKRIVERSRHGDAEHPRMPLTANGEPGEPLTNAELKALMNAFDN